MTLTYRQAGSIISSLSGSDRTIPLHITYVDLTGDHVAALFLAQVLYWSHHTKDKDGWFYKTGEEWHEELRLTYKQVTRVSKLLAPIGLESRVRKHKGAPKTFYRINYDVFIPVAQTFVDTGFSPLVKITKGENDKREKTGFCPKGKNDSAQREKTSISYSQNDIALDDDRDDLETPNRVSKPSPPESLSLKPEEKATNQETEILQPNTSVALTEKKQVSGTQQISNPGSNIPPATILSPEETVVISPRENASLRYEQAFQARASFPNYRLSRDKKAIKPEFLEAIVKRKLPEVPHYGKLAQTRKLTVNDARTWVYGREKESEQDLLEELYTQYCSTPKSTGVEAATNTLKVQTQTESLTSRVKGSGLMSKWNALHTEV